MYITLHLIYFSVTASYINFSIKTLTA